MISQRVGSTTTGVAVVALGLAASAAALVVAAPGSHASFASRAVQRADPSTGQLSGRPGILMPASSADAGVPAPTSAPFDPDDPRAAKTTYRLGAPVPPAAGGDTGVAGSSTGSTGDPGAATGSGSTPDNGPGSLSSSPGRTSPRQPVAPGGSTSPPAVDPCAGAPAPGVTNPVCDLLHPHPGQPPETICASVSSACAWPGSWGEIPVGVSAADAGVDGSSITVSWSAGAQDLGVEDPVHSYVVRLFQGSWSMVVAEVGQPLSAGSYTFTDLAPGEYEVGVAEISDAGRSGYDGVDGLVVVAPPDPTPDVP